MSQKTANRKTLPVHRDYPDAEPSYDGPDVDYDAVDADSDETVEADQDAGDQVDADTGFPAPDEFPDSLFCDEPRRSAKRGAGHGDS